MQAFFQGLWDALYLLLIVAGLLPLAGLLALRSLRGQVVFSFWWGAAVFVFALMVLQGCIAVLCGMLGVYGPVAFWLCHVAGLGVGLLGWWKTGLFAGAPHGGWRAAFLCRWGRAEAVVLSLAGFYGLVVVYAAFSVPVLEWDSLYYHLPRVITWLQESRLVYLHWNTLAQVDYYPYTWEAVCGMYIAPSGWDMFVFFPNLHVWLLSGFSVAGLVRLARAGRLAALVAGVVAMSLPMQVEAISSVRVDLAFGAVFLFALFVLAHEQGGGLVGWIWLCVWYMAGIKMSAFYYIPLLGIAGLLELTSRDGRRRLRLGAGVFRSGWAYAILLAGPLVGGYWYLANFWKISNPLGLIPVELFGRSLFSGFGHFKTDLLIRETSLAGVFRPLEWADWRNLLSAIWNSTGTVALLAVVLTFFWLTLALRSGRRGVSGGVWRLAVLCILAFGLYSITPYSGDIYLHGQKISPWVVSQMRFSLIAWSLLVAAALGGAAHWNRQREALVACVILALAGPFFVRGAGFLSAFIFPFYMFKIGFLVLVVMGFSFGGLWGVRFLMGRGGMGAWRIAGWALCLVVVLLLAGRRRAEAWQRHDQGVGAGLDRIVGEEAAVGFLGPIKVYRLYGSAKKRPVRSLVWLVEEREPWMDLLRREKIAAVVVQAEGHALKKTPEYEWLQQAPFREVPGFSDAPGLQLFLLEKQP